ncbi:hypothetical protein [Leptolyngbya sp. FACHB-17]|uniref:hypothetical protein n=1 Tax=unclassified Leptolyngbya TaxID=2650499 RepID=UPI00168186D5|nr:hypothetical protein [Leptolyngbya sp. FACHB-17]MBD2081661.1 hypothetical protein [Leptolyngbya sp. FACHB-17]
MEIFKLSGAEIISQVDVTVQNFWAWAYSDILSNRNRSIFAEFLVAAALGLTHQPRIEWDAVDLRYCGRKIEVKSSAYIQSWQQKKPSLLKFDIAKKRGWDAEVNVTAEEESRGSDCYVFCIYAEQNVNVLDLEKWLFIVVATEEINEVFGEQKSISFTRLQRVGQPIKYDRLKYAVDSVLSMTGASAK